MITFPISSYDTDLISCDSCATGLGRWGLSSRWQHLACTVFHKSLESADVIDGYLELSDSVKKEVNQRFKASLLEVDSDLVPVNPDELVRKEWAEKLEPCDDLLMPLLPYQKEGLGWMVAQESSDALGGILADEVTSCVIISIYSDH